jgi:hypothetical protein
MVLEARRTAGIVRALEDDTGDPPDTINLDAFRFGHKSSRAIADRRADVLVSCPSWDSHSLITHCCCDIARRGLFAVGQLGEAAGACKHCHPGSHRIR